MQFSGSFFDQRLYFRKTDNWGNRPWQKVILESPDGLVGINNDNPVYNLDVNGKAKADILYCPSLAMFEYDVFPYDSKYMDNNGIRWVGDSWRPAGNYTCWLSGYAGIKFFTNGFQKMAITAAGNVGIGTTSPPEKLSVEGTIASRRVKVTQTAWPDYVFEKNYPLRALDSVEAFVSTHKHLPEVKPAAQIISDGLDLGENQAALLKKVEELTLYIIELNKTVKQLNTDNIAQKEQLKKLQALIGK